MSADRETSSSGSTSGTTSEPTSGATDRLRLEEVVRILQLEELERNIFRGVSPQERRPRVFGGQVAAQALWAAAATVPAEHKPHSLHSYFLRSGDYRHPIIYTVDRIRDGRSFTTRRVVAIQNGEPIFNLSASFHVEEEGVSHHIPMPEAPPPESLASLPERIAAFERELPERMLRPRPVDMRWCDPRGWKPSDGGAPHAMVWMRADGKLPTDDPLLHTCMVVYASDYTLTETVMRPHRVHWSDPGVMAASLDHSMWFHAPVRADEWWLYVEDSPAARGARGLARGSIYTRDGQLVCSVAQEILLRTTPKK